MEISHGMGGSEGLSGYMNENFIRLLPEQLAECGNRRKPPRIWIRVMDVRIG